MADNRQIDLLQLGRLFGIHLPSKAVIIVALVLIVLVPLVMMYQAYVLKKLSDTGIWFWIVMALGLTALGIYLYLGLKVGSIVNNFPFRESNIPGLISGVAPVVSPATPR